jgi:hypothetical protein
MEFLKKNYEKVLLAVVLLGLTVAACGLPFIISAERNALAAYIGGNVSHVKPIPPMDMSGLDAALQRAQAQVKLDYTTGHNLFNPVLWKKFPDGHLLKETSENMEGPDALVVTDIKPLYLEISYSTQSGSGYMMHVKREAALREGERLGGDRFVSRDSKSDLFTLQDVKGPAQNPTELDLVWKETDESIVITPGKPFRRVDGYTADLKYPPEPGKTWTDRRVGSRPLNFANGAYNIVAITESNVVVSAESNKKKTTITFHPATEPR